MGTSSITTLFRGTLFAGCCLFAITRTETTLAGEPALVVEGLPGRNEARHLYAIHNDTVYHLWLEPLDIAEVADEAEAAWQMALDSFTFLR